LASSFLEQLDPDDEGTTTLINILKPFFKKQDGEAW
jgi:hypothetical protein